MDRLFIFSKRTVGINVVDVNSVLSPSPVSIAADLIVTWTSLAEEERITKRHRRRSNSRTGVARKTYERYLASIGWAWTPCMQIGQGCKVHLLKSELPSGRLIVRLSKHLTCVIDGVIYDSHDPSREGDRPEFLYQF
jgi:hypothetical protein